MTKSIPRRNPLILEEATAWFIDFTEDEVDEAGREEFSTWLRMSPEHVRAFLQISAFWEDAGTLGRRPDLDIDSLVARARAEHNVVPLELTAHERTQKETPHKRWQPKQLWLATAASIFVCLGVGIVTWPVYRGSTHATSIGEQRSITLEDGSSVELNSRSRIRVRFTDTQRSVDLIEGQALFTVAKNPALPFVVSTGDAHVRAIGTQFDVYRKRSGTAVTVVEGRVAVAPNRSRAASRDGSGVRDDASSRVVTKDALGVRLGEVLLAAGEQLIVNPTAIETPKPANIAVATAWTERRLIFESTPLREVVEEFNRYNRQQLVIRDPELYDFHVSGVFPSTDSSRMVEFLRQRFGVTMNRSRDEIEISRRETVQPVPDSATLEAPAESSGRGASL